MLLRFGVENHLSIRERQELVLTAAKRIKRSAPAVPVPILKEAAVPVAVLYGANAAGKSNLIHAIRMMRAHIVKSHKSRDAADGIPHYPFLLDGSSADKPTRFDAMFTVSGRDAGAQEVYEYGFSFTDTEYMNEWLHRIVRDKRQTTQVLFHRETKDGDVQVSFGGLLRGENRAIASLTRPNSLFLSAAAQNNHPQLGAVQRQFVEQWQLVRRVRTDQLAEMFARFEHEDAFVELMRQADLGVVGTEIEDYEIPEAMREKLQEVQYALAELPGSANEGAELTLPQKRFRFTHATAGGERALDYRWESRGTRMLATLAIPMLNAISAGHLVVADELDSSLHHRLTEALLQLFRSANQNGAQLIAAVQDTALLRDGLELDEVWLAEKDAAGASRFIPLTDFRIRSREDLEKVYRDGRVGGAPVIGDLAVALNG